MNYTATLTFLLLMNCFFAGYDARRTNRCGMGRYGYGCSDFCHCQSERCDGDGNCENYGCKPEWSGPRCDKKKQDATITYQCVHSGLDKEMKVMIQTNGVFYRDVGAMDETLKEQTWCWDTHVSPLHEPRDIITVDIKLTQRARRDMRNGKCAGKITGDDQYEWLLAIREWKKVSLGMQQYVRLQCNFNQSETNARYTRITSKEKPKIQFTTPQAGRDNVDLILLDALTREVVTTAAIGQPVILQIKFGPPIKSVTPRNCYVTTAKQDRWQQIVDYNGCKERDSPVKPFKTSPDPNALETPWFPYFSYDGSSYTQYQCDYKICYDTTCPVGCARRRDIRSVSDHDGVVKTPIP